MRVSGRPTNEWGPHPCWWRVCYWRGLPRLVSPLGRDGQTWNLSHTLHGQKFFGKDFTPKHSMKCVSFLEMKPFVWGRKNVLPPVYPSFLPYPPLYHCFPKFYSIGPIKLTKKCLTLQQQVNLKPTAYGQSLILRQGGQILHGQCPWVRDKFHVWRWGYHYIFFQHTCGDN